MKKETKNGCGCIVIGVLIFLVPLVYFLAPMALVLAVSLLSTGALVGVFDIFRQFYMVRTIYIVVLISVMIALLGTMAVNYKAYYSNGGKKKRTGAVLRAALVISTVSLLSLLYIFPEVGESGEFKLERKNVAHYLKEKYGQDFAIKKVEYIRPESWEARRIRTYVVSNDESPMEFIVERMTDLPNSAYAEAHWHVKRYTGSTYLELKWIREVTPRIEEVAKPIFLRPTFLEATVMLPGYFNSRKFGTVPSYFETLRTNPELFQDKLTQQVFQLIFFHTINESDKAEEAKKIYAFMSGLERMGISHYTVDAAYFAPEFADEGKKAIARIGVKEMLLVENGFWDIPEYKQSGQLLSRIIITDEGFRSMKDSSDLIKEFSKEPKRIRLPLK
jgi:hypothetical protein